MATKTPTRTGAPAPKITAPRLRVSRSGETFEVQTMNADLVNWDRTRAKHRWPKTEEAPFLWLTFISWSAARRTHVIPENVTYEAWEATTEDITAIDADGNALAGDETGEPVDPTPSGPALG